mmetsp:Transcript_24391/g.38357  ORF Transcript_24391/g.38357 Transcript_24391/m.38357 type:complete len:93 (+) Transcript_24391:763-1041(+)
MICESSRAVCPRIWQGANCFEGRQSHGSPSGAFHEAVSLLEDLSFKKTTDSGNLPHTPTYNRGTETPTPWNSTSRAPSAAPKPAQPHRKQAM